MPMTPDERFDRLDDFIARGAILRGAWKRMENGREYACLLAALSPEVAGSGDASRCPADTIAPWLAYMLPRMDDCGSIEAWPAMIRRVAATVRRCHRWLQPEDWRRSDYAVRAAALREALPFAGASPKLLIEQVMALCDRAARGEPVSKSEWTAAQSAASKWLHTSAAAAWLACDELAAAARSTTAAAAAHAERVIGDDEGRALWDRMSAVTLDILDAACAAREAEGN